MRIYARLHNLPSHVLYCQVHVKASRTNLAKEICLKANQSEIALKAHPVYSAPCNFTAAFLLSIGLLSGPEKAGQDLGHANL